MENLFINKIILAHLRDILLLMINKKILIFLIIIIVLLGVGYKVFLFKQPNLSSPSLSKLVETENVQPSKTLKNYIDESGFSFNYPDNLSISSNELKEDNYYAQLQITTKDVGGSLALNITDSKYKTINDWIKTFTNKTSKEVDLGSLKAMEIESDGKILLGALDSGIFFNIEVNFGESKDYWMSVYQTVLKDFAFSAPTVASDVGGFSDVSYDGEEVVE